MTVSEFRTASGVRLRPVAERAGDLNWLLLPGGPGIGSESLHGLAEAAGVPGVTWLVDLPGDGSNTVGGEPFARWPEVLAEAAEALPRVVFLGHSTGGMYLLSVPELEPLLAGLVLVSSAPHAGWLADFERMVGEHPLPAVDAAGAVYEADPTDEHLRRLTVASAPWNFTPAGLSAGAEMLARMPYNTAAVDWSARHFDSTYELRWWPASVPTLIVSGAQDRIVTQRLWDEPRFQGPHVLHRRIEDAAHFPWIEQPSAVRAALHELAALVTAPTPENVGGSS
ncbi:alpha/beta hydrolase [Dactylosporangium sp. NPDC049742]|uniref:alpha/beta fold hydrolase n=1 Tax=Dactylosporangium sp. NPDC049742 TaxID=3154737 RepID=UPI003418F9F6